MLAVMGSLNDVLVIGNSYRQNNGLRVIELKEWLSRKKAWEFIHEVEVKYGKKLKSEKLTFGNYRRSNGQLEYSKLIIFCYKISTW